MTLPRVQGVNGKIEKNRPRSPYKGGNPTTGFYNPIKPSKMYTPPPTPPLKGAGRSAACVATDSETRSQHPAPNSAP